MKLCDVNVLIYAHREESVEHEAYAALIRQMAEGPSSFGLSESILSGFVRIVTNPRIFRQPTPTEVAFEFCEQLRRRSQAVVLRPGGRNWVIFQDLCRAVSARGKLVADAWHAALAIEHGCEWLSTDADYARFPHLNWSHPLGRKS
ncbi:type II toxin-antitoxin system VapC family toxin [Oscillatoria laete-virens NRMC-F 0139]|nr:type II toxin-antitoxin system VapC family toxin [Oscillatoria laete-virens]MDL5054790.1 type II toxin-antitoxin system VapC family toxin [Oscillatoria laete-virens NRMC-F 0139]